MAQVPDPGKPNLEIEPEESLTSAVSAEDAPVVQEFMAEAAEANEAEVEAAAEETDFAGAARLQGAEFTNHGTGPYIAFEGVCKSFGDFVVLKDVSFFVNPGETLCIMGRSGVGKSVSLQILMGFLKADRGTVLVAGQDITSFTEPQMQEVRRKVTMVFQSGALFDSITVGENVAFPLREREHMEEDQIQKLVTGLLDMVGVMGMKDLLPSDLSTGMKRSVTIGSTLEAIWETNPNHQNAAASHEHCRKS
jgi:phospholipid/cholesterol/gamma-HCH transport system ATP-binding protein